MKFAINYSEASARLLRSKQIQIDLFKIPDWPELIQSVPDINPAYVHFNLSTCDNHFQNVNWEFIENTLANTDTPHVNVHINAPLDLDPNDRAQCARAIETMVSDVALLVSRFGKDQVVIENCPKFEHDYDYQYPAVLPETIQLIIRETGCGFLFDISHARISARSLKMDEMDYIGRLPIERLRELHITGLKVYQGNLTDHFELSEEDWKIITWVAEQIAQHIWPEPIVAAFEYGGIGDIFAFRTDPEIISNQVPRLYSLFSTTANNGTDS